MTEYIKREDAIDAVLDVYYNAPDIERRKQSKHGTGGVVMTVIEFAEKRLNESCLNDNDEAALYWRAYLDGARARGENAEESVVAANE